MLPAADLLWVAINLTFAWQGALQVGHLLRFSYISPALQWNMALIYLVVPIGFLLMSFRILEGYWNDWRRGTLGRPVDDATLAGGGEADAEGGRSGGTSHDPRLLLGTLAICLVIGVPVFMALGIATVVALTVSDVPMLILGRPSTREWTSSPFSRSPASSSPAL